MIWLFLGNKKCVFGDYTESLYSHDFYVEK